MYVYIYAFFATGATILFKYFIVPDIHALA